MEPVRHRRFPGCSLARHALQHGSDATSPVCTDSVLLRAFTLHCAHHSFGATEESPSTVAKNPSTIETTVTAHRVKWMFPVSLEDVGGASLFAEMKAITLMRYIRKALEDKTFVKAA